MKLDNGKELVLPNASHFAALGACAALNELQQRLERLPIETRAAVAPIILELMIEFSEKGVVDA